MKVVQLEKQLELKEFSTRRRLAALKRQLITESLKSSAELIADSRSTAESKQSNFEPAHSSINDTGSSNIDTTHQNHLEPQVRVH